MASSAASGLKASVVKHLNRNKNGSTAKEIVQDIKRSSTTDVDIAKSTINKILFGDKNLFRSEQRPPSKAPVWFLVSSEPTFKVPIPPFDSDADEQSNYWFVYHRKSMCADEQKLPDRLSHLQSEFNIKPYSDFLKQYCESEITKMPGENNTSGGCLIIIGSSQDMEECDSNAAGAAMLFHSKNMHVCYVDVKDNT